jgi:NAD-binding of NADP-dependent 3-hydroxyisobutyrate dehydrogenase
MVTLIVRWLAAAVGAGLVLAAWASVIGTLMVPRRVTGWLTRGVDGVVDAAFRLLTRGIADYRGHDRVLAAQAAAIILAQLAAWLGLAFVGCALPLWPFTSRGVTTAFTEAGSSLFTLGFLEPAGAAPAAQGREQHLARVRGGGGCRVGGARAPVGLETSTGMDALGDSPLVSAWQAAKLQRIAEREFSPQFALSLALKDVHLALQAAGDNGFTVLACLAEEWQQVVDDGLGDQDLTVVTRALERAEGTP